MAKIFTASVFNRHLLLQIAVDSIVIELSYYFRYFCRNIQSQIDFYRMAPLPVRFFDKLGYNPIMPEGEDFYKTPLLS